MNTDITENAENAELAENTADDAVKPADVNPRRNVNFLNTKEAASYLKCSVMSVRRAVNEGRLACRRFSPSRNSRLCFEIADLDAFIQSTKEWKGRVVRNSKQQEPLPQELAAENDRKFMVCCYLVELNQLYHKNRYSWSGDGSKREYIYAVSFVETNGIKTASVDDYIEGYCLDGENERRFENLEQLIIFHRCHIRALNEIEANEAAGK